MGRSTILQRGWDTPGSDGVITIGDNGATPVNGVTIADLAIDGVKATFTGVENFGIFFDNVVTYSTVRNTYIHDNDGYGIIFQSSSNNNLITGNDVRSNDSYGIYLSSANNNTITGNNSQLNTSYGILVNSSDNNTITGNNSQSTNGHGIALLQTSENNIVTGNSILSSGLDGINVSSSDENSITGNTIDGVGASEDGISIIGTSSNNVISGNTIIDTSGSAYGINITVATANSNYLIGNEIFGAGFASGKIQDLGSGTTIQHRDQFAIAANMMGQNYGAGQNVILTINNASTTAFDPYVDFQTASSSAWRIGVDDSDGNKLRLAPASFTATSSGITINASGFVGIGTTNPLVALDITGALTVSGAVTITSGTITGITDLTVSDGGTGRGTLATGETQCLRQG